MSTISQRIHRSQMPGYWAVEIRQSEVVEPQKQYLCQAQDDASAAAIAERLMDFAPNARGFNYYWIDKARLEGSGATLPMLGEHQTVAGPAEWAELIAAHDASELAAPERRGLMCTFHVSQISEAWQVSRDETVYGEFDTRGDAIRAACFGARAQDRHGRGSQVLMMPGDQLVPHYEPHFGE